MNGDETVQSLGKYQIVAEIGRGGFATVYRAVDTTLDRQVALKVLDPLLMRDQNWVTRFQREAKAVARLRHPHIITIHEIGEAEGQLFIAMELVEGPGLDGLIAERGGLPWDETLEILDQVAQALDYAHGEGIVHRDLKPGNILLDLRKGVLLTDFGFARLVGESSMSVSLSGGVVGTPAYIAPEVWQDRGVTAATDVYALSCIVVEMLTGQVLFEGSTPAAVMTRHVIEGPAFPQRWPAGVPVGLEAVLRRGLAQDAGERIQSAGRLVSQLRALSGKHRAAVAPTRRPGETIVTPPGERERQSGLPPALLGVVGLAAVGLLVVGAVAALVVSGMLGGGRPTPTPAVAALPTELPPPTPVPTNSPVPPTPIPAPAAADVFIRPADSMEMAYVPEGQFTMGSPDGVGEDDEHPQHGVYLDAFWIDRYEVTNDQFRQCVEAGACDAPTSCAWGEPTYGDAGKGDHPVVCVSWHDAEAYCQWTGARLPTEAEWEKAARGTDAREYPWGDEFDCHRGNFDEEQQTDESVVPGGPHCDGYSRTAPVGSFPAGASPYGALDMAGNVWEWVADWYDHDYYSRSPNTNPQGPDSGEYRVVRGGSWFNYQSRARSAYRVRYFPGGTDLSVGFRCCVS